MNKQFVEEWLQKLKEYWFRKDIESAVSLFQNTTFYQENPFMKPYTKRMATYPKGRYSINRNKTFSNRWIYCHCTVDFKIKQSKLRWNL